MGAWRWRRLRLSVTIGVLLATVTRTASAAPDQQPLQAQQPKATDPVVVVESFLAARNARDAWGATDFCARLLAVHDAGGRWIADPPTVKDWLQRLTDTYTIDTLVRPTVQGDTVRWVERLVPRSLRFPDALAYSHEVPVEVLVQDGKIATYTAPYPALAPPSAETAPVPGSGPPPAVLFGATALAAVMVVLLLGYVGPALWRARRSPCVRAPRRGLTRREPSGRRCRSTQRAFKSTFGR
jgi:hypothetical protein